MTELVSQGCAALVVTPSAGRTVAAELKVPRRRADPSSGRKAMNRIFLNRLLLLLALSHFLTDAGFAGGAVLCIGADDHRAVESEVSANLGCASTSAGASTEGEVAGLSAAAPLSADCVDRPLHSEAELVSSQPHGVNAPPAAAIFPTTTLPSVESASCVRPRARAPSQTAAYRAVRTTVLIV